MSYNYLKFDAEAAIGTITLNRPEKRNALSLELLQELSALLTIISRNNDMSACAENGVSPEGTHLRVGGSIVICPVRNI